MAAAWANGRQHRIGGSGGGIGIGHSGGRAVERQARQVRVMYRAKVAGRESDRRQDLSMVDGRDGIALIARTARQTAGAGMGKNGRRHEMAAGEAEAVMAVAAVAAGRAARRDG